MHSSAGVEVGKQGWLMCYRMFSSIPDLSSLGVSSTPQSGQPKRSPDIAIYPYGVKGPKLPLTENHHPRLEVSTLLIMV